MRARIEDERRMERDRLEKEEMRKLLARQMAEKQKREQAEKALNDELFALKLGVDLDHAALQEVELVGVGAG